MTGAYRCPVCGGNGIQPGGFYTQTTGEWVSDGTGIEQCQACGGSGVVWIEPVPADQSGKP